MKKFLFNLFSTLFNKEMNQMKATIKSEAYYEYHEKNKEENRQIELFSLKEMIGKPIIVVSNEWDDVIVGFATEVRFITQSQQPILVMKNHITGEEMLVSGKVYAYTLQKLNAILKLDPYELCSLIYYPDVYEDFDKEKTGVRNSSEEFILKLKQSGFFEQTQIMLN